MSPDDRDLVGEQLAEAARLEAAADAAGDPIEAERLRAAAHAARLVAEIKIALEDEPRPGSSHAADD